MLGINFAWKRHGPGIESSDCLLMRERYRGERRLATASRAITGARRRNPSRRVRRHARGGYGGTVTTVTAVIAALPSGTVTTA